MKRLLLLLALGVLQSILLAQVPPIQDIKSSNIELEKQQKTKSRRQSLYLSPSIFLDIPYQYELFVGYGLNYDLRIDSFFSWAHTGVSATLGQIRGSEGRYNKGPFFKIGPKLFLGSSRKCATIGLQYFQFNEETSITYHGLALGVGLALTLKSGFFFHPKMEYQYSASKEKTKNPNPPLKNLEMEIGLGYSF